ncbi:MAG: ATP phosphoribosyltransferase [Ginsengibacter sp.]
MLKIAVQKSGRLHDESIGLLKECGIHINNGNGQLKTIASNFPIEIYFLRDDDIPQYVEDSVADLGIVGANILMEKEKKVEQILPLSFGNCRLSIAVVKNKSYTGIQDLQGLKIATSYPHILKKYLNEQKVSAEVHEISGSVEIAPGIGLADAICDLVSSGSTLFSNGLKEVQEVMRSEAILIGCENLSPDKNLILDKLLLRIKAVLKAKNNKYIMLNAPDHRLKEIAAVLPGMKSPTIVPLAEEGWSSVQSVVNEEVFWDVIEKLKDLDAEGILVIPIEKMIL